MSEATKTGQFKVIKGTDGSMALLANESTHYKPGQPTLILGTGNASGNARSDNVACTNPSLKDQVKTPVTPELLANPSLWDAAVISHSYPLDGGATLRSELGNLTSGAPISAEKVFELHQRYCMGKDPFVS